MLNIYIFMVSAFGIMSMHNLIADAFVKRMIKFTDN